MRLSKDDKEAKIIEFYEVGHPYLDIQKRYHVSPRDISRLVRGREVKCSVCGRPKGKVRFHAHHPDRVNRPDYTIPLCPSCHAKEEARLRREKENQPQSASSSVLPPAKNPASKPTSTFLSVPPKPLSPTEKKILIGGVVALLVEDLWPGFFKRRWQEIQAHIAEPSRKKPLMGLYH